MEPVTIPKHIDEPITLLIWSADEFVPFALVVIFGMLIGQLTISLILSVVVIKACVAGQRTLPEAEKANPMKC